MAKSYTKRADGRYQKRVPLINEYGIKYIKVVYARTLADLEDKVRRIISDNERGLYRNDDITVGQYTEKWLHDICGKCADNTYVSYTYSIKHVRETIGLIQLRELGRSDIQAAVDSFEDRPRTAQYLRMTIKRLCNSAVDDGIIARNPCRNISLPKYKAKEKRTLTAVEVQAIAAADLDAEERLFISLLYYCGLRRGEALALGRGDIDLKRRVLTVNHSLAFIDYKGVLKEPKTEKSRREIPMPSELVKLIQSYNNDSLYLFTRGSHFFTHSVYVKFWARILRKLNEAAGGGAIDRIQGLTAHIFRHNYASLLRKRGVDVKTAQAYLGHSSSKVTMDIYTHLDELDSKKVAAIDDVFEMRLA